MTQFSLLQGGKNTKMTIAKKLTCRCFSSSAAVSSESAFSAVLRMTWISPLTSSFEWIMANSLPAAASFSVCNSWLRFIPALNDYYVITSYVIRRAYDVKNQKYKVWLPHSWSYVTENAVCLTMWQPNFRRNTWLGSFFDWTFVWKTPTLSLFFFAVGSHGPDLSVALLESPVAGRALVGLRIGWRRALHAHFCAFSSPLSVRAVLGRFSENDVNYDVIDDFEQTNRMPLSE